MPKRQCAGYDYLGNDEWVSRSKLSNYRMMNTITNTTLDKYKPSVLVENINISGLLNENIDIVGVNKNKKVNSNRKKIQQILRDEESALVIKELIDLRNKLKNQSENITTILSDNLNISDYYQFLKNLDSKTKRFIFRNINKNGDIPKDLSLLQDYGDKLMEVLPEIEGNEIRSKIKKDKEYIKYSISSAMSWKYVDLTKHSIGQLKDIMEFTIELSERAYERNIKLAVVDKNNMIQKIYEPYIEEKDRSEFFNSITLEGVSFKKNMIWYEQSSSNKDRPDIFENHKSGFTVKTGVENALKKAQGDEPEFAREFLVVVLSYVVGHVIGQFENISDIFNDFQKRRYGGKYTQIYKNIKFNLDTYDKIIDNAIYNFFNMTNKDFPHYGIQYATSDKNARLSGGENSVLRIIGGSKMIKGIDKFNERTYPLFGTKSEMVNKLVDMIGHSPKVDIHNKNFVLAMGGFIQKEFIGRMSIKILHDYFDRLVKSKDTNVRYIDKVLDNMRRGVHIKDLTNMRTKVENKYKEIGKITNRGSKDLRARTAINSMMAEYGNLRNMELENLLSLDMIEHAIRNNPEKMAIVGDKIVKMRDEAFTKFGHYQLKAHAYKTIAFGLYEQMSRSDPSKYPPAYLGEMQSAFAKADRNVLDKLMDKTNSEKYSRLKNSILTGLISKDIATLNIALPPTKHLANKNLNRITNYNRTLRTPTSWSEVESKSYWEKAKKSLDGLTIYIPFVDISVLDLGHQHGLFDLINSAIDGKIKESRVFSAITDHIIPGSKLDRGLISRRLRAQGMIMVSNAESELREPNKWRCMLKKDINNMKALGEKDLRRKIYTILSNKADYQMETPYLWPRTSYTKEKVILYCRTTTGVDLYKCPLLISRNKVVSKIG